MLIQMNQNNLNYHKIIIQKFNKYMVINLKLERPNLQKKCQI